MLSKPTVVIHDEVLELGSNGDLILSVPKEVCGPGGEECGESTRELALCRELVDVSSFNPKAT